jgi:hypothetical protein
MNKSILWITVLTGIAGIILFALQQEYILIRFSKPSIQIHNSETMSPTKKIVYLYLWQPTGWRTEQQEILWGNDTASNARLLITAWLTVAYEEHMLATTVTVQSCALSTSGQELYISLSHNPLEKDQPMITKWMFIEGLLKTVRENKLPLQTVHVLDQYQPLKDPHISSDLPWPITGFLQI